MNYSDIKILFIDKEKIKRKADLFREKFWDDSIPVDIERIIDLKLEIDIIPLPDLGDAFISSDWKSIYVDRNKYLNGIQNRLRFSLAHEIGHFILHKEIYNSFKITSLEKFYQFIAEIPGEQYGFLETQANIFANFLLVPRNKLAVEKEKRLKDFESVLDNIDQRLVYSYLAEPISKTFGVSSEVIEIALNERR